MRQFLTTVSGPTELKSPPVSERHPWDAVVRTFSPQLVMLVMKGGVEVQKSLFRKENPHIIEVLSKGDPAGIVLRPVKFMDLDYIVEDVLWNSSGHRCLRLVAKDPENNVCIQERVVRGSTKVELQDRVDSYIEYRRVMAEEVFNRVDKSLKPLLPRFSYEVGVIRFRGEKCVNS